MESITEALVQAGYFRARISTLSDFDKIIGGMAWAMQVFSYDIDINIFYTDTLDLGEKIALTERLVMVLLVMNCPNQIEPHQIVGLDYANLLPVICWLIRKSSEARQEHEAFNRLLALRHFFRVTNSSQNRRDWFHCIPIEHLKFIKNSRGSDPSASAKHDNSSLPASMAATASLLDRLEQDFGDSKQVSFVKLPSLLRVTSGDEGGTVRIENEQDGDDDEDIADTDLYQKEVEQVRSKSSEKTLREEDELSREESAKVHKELDTELLATNQKILNLYRKLDSKPNDLEICQYQRRYIELHQQLISNNKHLKKLFALFNSLDSTRHYLTKEINLLDSIFDNLDLTNNSPENQFQFLKQFQEIIVKIQNVKDDVVSRLNIMKKKCDSLNEEYAALTEKLEEKK